MNLRRNLLIALGSSALTCPLASHSQPTGKLWRIGYLDLGSRQSMIDAGRYNELIKGLRERGLEESKNYIFEMRTADGNSSRLDELAKELVKQQVDVILTMGTPASHAAQRATGTIPIVVIQATDPVGEGFAASLARPGANLTGMTSGIDDMVKKLVELLILTVPKLERIAVLNNPENVAHPAMLSNIQAAATKTGKQILPVYASSPEEIERGFAGMKRARAQALIILGDSFLFSRIQKISELALQHRLPSIYTNSGYAKVGGLMNYGADFNDNYRRVGLFVEKILKGTKPGDIPFEQPTRYYLEINRNSARRLGIKINEELLTRADKVIE
jgi:putative ABC transport system substrate-binding protein